MNSIDLNCDMGESFGMYKMGFDEDVIKFIMVEHTMVKNGILF